MANGVDLSLLPAPQVIEALSFEDILADLKADLVARHPAAADVIDLESEPVVKLLEVVAYRELTLRARINDAAQSVMLAYAVGADLDHLVALYGIDRREDESDSVLRGRAQLSLEGFSVAGPIQAYRFHALSASPSVRDVAVLSPSPGVVRLVVLAQDGVPDAALLATVLAAASADTVRPLCDTVEAVAPAVIDYAVQASLICLPGPDTGTVLAAAQQACQRYVAEQFYLGRDIAQSGLLAALHQPGVMRVEMSSPSAHLTVASDQVANCTLIAITLGGTGQ